jgi:hypothetical protein
LPIVYQQYSHSGVHILHLVRGVLGNRAARSLRCSKEVFAMDFKYVLAELRRERDAIEAAIANLERLDRPGDSLRERSPNVSTNGFHRSLSPEESSS